MTLPGDKSAAFVAQMAGGIAVAFALGGAGATPAWALCGAAIPCALALAAEAARRLGERRAIAAGAGLCDVSIDPLAPDWRGTAQGVIGVFSRALVESRDVRIRFLPCGGDPYRITVMPPRRNSSRPRLSIAPCARNSTDDAVEIPAISVRIPLPVEIAGTMETVWVSPVGGRIRLQRCPPEVSRLERMATAIAAACTAGIASFGFFRAALLAASCIALKLAVERRNWVAMHVVWLSALTIAAMLFHDAAPAFFGDPLRVAFYAYMAPLALWRLKSGVPGRAAPAAEKAK